MDFRALYTMWTVKKINCKQAYVRKQNTGSITSITGFRARHATLWWIKLYILYKWGTLTSAECRVVPLRRSKERCQRVPRRRPTSRVEQRYCQQRPRNDAQSGFTTDARQRHSAAPGLKWLVDAVRHWQRSRHQSDSDVQQMGGSGSSMLSIHPVPYRCGGTVEWRCTAR